MYTVPVTPSLFALLVANAFPIAGVLFLGWKVFPLVLLYWLENVVVGGFNVAKMLLAQPREPVYWLGKAFTAASSSCTSRCCSAARGH